MQAGRFTSRGFQARFPLSLSLSRRISSHLCRCFLCLYLLPVFAASAGQATPTPAAAKPVPPKGIPNELVAPKAALSSQKTKKPNNGKGSTGGTTTRLSAVTSGGVAIYTEEFNVQAFQSDLFSGAGQAEIPIVVPPGAAGVAPKVALRYSTSLAETVNSWNDQAPGPGLGWTVDVGGYIVRETNGRWPEFTNDRLMLIMGGASYELVLVSGSQNVYHTRDETFMELKYDSPNDYWTLKTKDGKVHRFGYNTDSKVRGLRPDLVTEFTTRYMLDEVKTTSSVAVTYSYWKQTATEHSHYHTYDQAVYPDVIRYAYRNGSAVGDVREVRFYRSDRTDFYDSSNQYFMAFFENKKIDKIEVKVGTSLVRRYEFTQDYSLQGHLALKSIRLIGNDNVSYLPDINFAYNPDNLLATVTNGLGGSTSFTYEKIVPLYTTPRQVWNSENGWECSGTILLTSNNEEVCESTPAGVASTPPFATIPIYKTPQPYWNSETGWECGGIIVMTTDPNAYCGSTLVDYVSATSGLMNVPIYNNNDTRWDPETGLECTGIVSMSTVPSSYCNSALVGYLYSGTVDRTRFRVKSRTLNDGLNWSATTAYQYYDPAVGTNSNWNSNETKEFRGHAKVRTINALGDYTDTWFHQDDLKKGRPYQTELRSAAGVLFNKTADTWSTSTTTYGTDFVVLSRSDLYECEGQSSCYQSATTYDYDAYGNRTQKYSLGNVSIGADERDERTDWLVDTDKWIHLPKRMALYNASGTVVRERWLYYDNAAWGSVGNGSNARGLLTKEESRLAGDRGNGGNPTFVHDYDNYGNKTSTTDPRSCPVTTTYDASQTYRATVTNCLNHVVSYQYDAGLAKKTQEIDPNNATTVWKYDAHGRSTKVIGPFDSETYPSISYDYPDLGNPALQRIITYRREEHGQTGTIWSEEYFDGLGRTDQTRAEGPGGNAIITETLYDARGLVWKTSAPHFANEASIETERDYDVLGRPVQVKVGGIVVGQRLYGQHMVRVIDGNFHEKREYKDAHDRLIKVEEFNLGQTYTTTYSYDAADSVTSVINAAQHNTTMVYDYLGRKVLMCDPNMGALSTVTNCTSSTPGVWKYDYYPAGDLKNQIDAKGQQLDFTYDGLGRIATKTTTQNSVTTSVAAWTYDDPAVQFSKGRLTKVVDRQASTNFQTTFSYDAMGRVTQTGRSFLSSNQNYTLTQSYNALSLVKSETFSDEPSNPIQYTYNEAGWLSSVPGYINSIGYNARGQKTAMTYANGVSTTWNYFDQPADTLKNFAVKQRLTGTNNVHQNLSYVYDSVGNVLSATDANFTATKVFTYDDLNRLTSTWFGNSGLTNYFTYDTIGNVTYRAQTYYYEDPKHPSAVTRLSLGNIYAYDDNGNMTNRNGVTINWDIDNRVTSIGSTTMEYDYTGMRVRKTSGGLVTHFPFKGYEVDLASGTVTKFIRIGNEMYASKKGATKYFYHNDHLGGVNVITDIGGNRVQLNEYAPWGGVSREEGTIVDPTHRFTGQERDPETGVYYYGGRYYDNSIGRFLSPDPYVQEPENPQSLNRYTYVLNNPVSYVDPSGHFWWLLAEILVWALEAATPAALEGAAAGAAISQAIGGAVILSMAASMQYTVFSQNGVTQVNLGPPPKYAEATKLPGANNDGSQTQDGLGNDKNGKSWWQRMRESIGRSPGDDTNGVDWATIIWGMAATIYSDDGGLPKQRTWNGKVISGKFEDHHRLPKAKEFQHHWKRENLDPENFTIKIPVERHRLLPDGVHTGTDNWNKLWREFFRDNPNASARQILQQLDKMDRRFFADLIK